MKRHRLNDRGDASSIQKRQKSVQSLGILHELLGCAYLLRVADPAVTYAFEVAHWATLQEAATGGYWAAQRTNATFHTPMEG